MVLVFVVVVVDFLAGSGLEDAPRLKSLPSVALRLRRPLPLHCREYTHSLEVRMHLSQPSRRPPHLCCICETIVSQLDVGVGGERTNLLCAALVTCRVAGSLTFTFPVQWIRGSLDEMSVIILSIVSQGTEHYD